MNGTMVQPYDLYRYRIWQTYTRQKRYQEMHLKDFLDDSLRNRLLKEIRLQPKLGDNPFKASTGHVGVGIAIQINQTDSTSQLKINLLSAKTDLLDGQQWQENWWW